jgi:hypothetical protein
MPGLRKAKTITMRANNDMIFLTSNCARDGTHSEEPIQTQINNLKAVIQSHAVPATAVQAFSADKIRALISVYNSIDHDGNGFATEKEVLKHYPDIRRALQLKEKACSEYDMLKVGKKLTQMDFSGDGTLDLREFLHFSTDVYSNDEDPLLVLAETFATTTTSHGLGRVVNESSLFRRILYLVAFLTSLSFFVMFTMQFLNDFYSYGVTSSVKVITNYSIVAPRITFCSASYIRCDCELWYDPIYSVKYDLTKYQCGTNRSKVLQDDSLQFTKKLCGSTFVGGSIVADTELRSEMTKTGKLSEMSLLRYARHEFVSSLSSKISSKTKYYATTVLDATAIMISCKYQGKNCLDTSNWNIFMDYRHGVCGTYVGEQQLMVGGPEGGISMILRAHTTSMLTGTGLAASHAGFHIFVESSNEPISLLNPLTAGVGMQTDIGLEVTHTNDVSIYESGNGLYSNCSMSNASGLEACAARCFITSIREKCACEPLNNEAIGTGGVQDSSLLLCSMSDNLGFRNSECPELSKISGKCCGVVQKDALESSMGMTGSDAAINSDSDNCIEKCQTPCNRFIYKTSTRASTWPSTQYANILAYKYEKERGVADTKLRNLDATLRSEMSAVTIYPSSTNILYIENAVAFPISSLFGSIGGTLGLFIGFSIITVVELIDFIIRFIWMITKRTAKEAREVSGDVADILGVSSTITKMGKNNKEKKKKKKKKKKKEHDVDSGGDGVTVVVPVTSSESDVDGGNDDGNGNEEKLRTNTEMMDLAVKTSGAVPPLRPPAPPTRPQVESQKDDTSSHK